MSAGCSISGPFTLLLSLLFKSNLNALKMQPLYIFSGLLYVMTVMFRWLGWELCLDGWDESYVWMDGMRVMFGWMGWELCLDGWDESYVWMDGMRVMFGWMGWELCLDGWDESYVWMDGMRVMFRWTRPLTVFPASLALPYSCTYQGYVEAVGSWFVPRRNMDRWRDMMKPPVIHKLLCDNTQKYQKCQRLWMEMADVSTTHSSSHCAI
jgi:hypothetical protein